MGVKLWLLIPFVSFWLGLHHYQSIWGCLLIYHFLLLFPLIIHRKRVPFSTFFKGWNTFWIALHIVVCIGLFYGLVYLAGVKGFDVSTLRAFGQAGIGFSIYFILVNPILEEWFWRGIQAPKNRGLIVEDIAFGSFHALILAPFLIPLYIVGFVSGLIAVAWIWRQLRWHLNGLAVPWIGHVLGDLLFVLIITKLRAG